jgi:uncharacterized protein YbaR (Trm112 family)
VLSPQLLERLVCPVSHGKLIYFPADNVLVCPASRLRYRIESGSPVMLAEEAETLSEAEIASLISQARSLGLPIPT